MGSDGAGLVGSNKPDCVTGSLTRGQGNGKTAVQGRTNLRLFTEMVNICVLPLANVNIKSKYSQGI